VIVNEDKGIYYLFYDGAGKEGWKACGNPSWESTSNQEEWFGNFKHVYQCRQVN